MTDSQELLAGFKSRCWICTCVIVVGDPVVQYGGDWVHQGCELLEEVPGD